MSTRVAEFPKLYKKTSTGAQQEWQVWTVENEIHTSWGQTGGAMQKAVDVVKTGKNLGKKNETSPIQQAEAEAQSQWEKKLKKGYVQDAGAAMKGEVDAIIEGGVAPMLAHRYDEQGHKIVWPAHAQPKMDGHRCIAVVRNGKCKLWSRTRKLITGVPHIARAIEQMCGPDSDIVFDGELYNHDYRTKFEELTSFIRQETPKPGHEVVEYHVYDTPSACNGSFDSRWFDLMHRLTTAPKCIVAVETIRVADEDELMLAFERFLSQGFEGAMVRNSEGLYVNKRSYDLQKVKEFIDGEFSVVAVEEGRGKLAGHAIFVCAVEKTNPATCFRAKMKGETAALKQYFDRPELAVGRGLTVKYQGMTKNGIPRFPVGVRFREEV